MKHISCTCDALLKPVKTVSGIVERNQSLPVVSNILFEQDGENVTFSTTDLDIQIRTSASVGSTDSKGNFTISAQKLSDILNNLKGSDAVEIDVEDDGRALLSCPSGQFAMQTLPARDFPVIRGADWLATFVTPAKSLRYLLAMTSFAMANHDIRYYLNGALFEAEKNELRCVATDTHRLAYCDTTVDGLNIEKPVKAILPRKTVRELLRILPEDDTAITVKLSNTQCAFEFLGIEFLSKLIDGNFPDYKRVMPTPETNPQPVAINREALLAALRRVQILTNEKFHGVRWLLAENHLQIQGTNAEQEEANQNLSIDWKWPELDIGFNITYVLDVLSNLKNSEVMFYFAATPKSVLVTMPESMNFRYVIMPMRI